MDDADLSDAAVEVELTGPENRGGGFYRYERYRVKLDGAAFERDAVRIGRVVVILPVDLERDEIVLIRQFRLGAHLALGKGDMVELPAGRVERGEDVADAARRECQEETGVAPRTLVPLFDLMPSPGSSDEHMFFFLGVVDAAKVPERAGAAHEQEDTRPLRVPIGRALEALEAGKLHYGAAVLGLQWLALNRDRLREIAAARHERHSRRRRRAAGRRMARRLARPRQGTRAARLAGRHRRSGRHRLRLRLACRRTACWRNFPTSKRSSISAPASTTCSPIPTCRRSRWRASRIPTSPCG